MLTESASNDMRARWFAALAEFLGREFPDTDRGPLSRIAAANSGAEAIEAALKFARVRTRRTGVVAFYSRISRPHVRRPDRHRAITAPRRVRSTCARIHPRDVQ
jgi:hypothetical protein